MSEKTEKQLAYEAEQARLALFEKGVEKMTHRQLVSELNRTSRRKHVGKGFSMHGFNFADLNVKKGRRSNGETTSLLDNAEAALCKIVLENTKTSPVFTFKKDGTPDRIARKDQIGSGQISHYLR